MRRVKKGRLLFLMMIVVSIGVCFFQKDKLVKKIEDSQISTYESAPLSYLDSSLESTYAILIRNDTQEVLLDKRKSERIYPASMTKIMTAYVVLQHTEDLSKLVSIPSDIISDLEQQDASMAGFQPMELVSIKDLLYGALLPSGADACVTLARSIVGSEEAFVKLMNETAQQLGMKQTQFTNVTGLHDAAHYSTAEDISILLHEALKNETFYKQFTTMQYQTKPDSFYPTGIYFTSTLQDSLSRFQLQNPFILGAKTGYTLEAGQCMASLGVVKEEAYLFISAKALGDHTTQPYHVLDALKVYQAISEKESKK